MTCYLSDPWKWLCCDYLPLFVGAVVALLLAGMLAYSKFFNHYLPNTSDELAPDLPEYRTKIKGLVPYTGLAVLAIVILYLLLHWFIVDGKPAYTGAPHKHATLLLVIVIAILICGSLALGTFFGIASREIKAALALRRKNRALSRFKTFVGAPTVVEKEGEGYRLILTDWHQSPPVQGSFYVPNRLSKGLKVGDKEIRVFYEGELVHQIESAKLAETIPLRVRPMDLPPPPRTSPPLV